MVVYIMHLFVAMSWDMILTTDLIHMDMKYPIWYQNVYPLLIILLSLLLAEIWYKISKEHYRGKRILRYKFK